MMFRGWTCGRKRPWASRWALAGVVAAGAGGGGRAMGQVEECGTGLSPAEAARALTLQRAGAYRLPAGPPRGVCTVPMTIHVVRRGDGTGGLEQAWVEACIADANTHFAPAGISFVQEGPTLFIDSDALYEINITDETNILRQLLVVPGTINIYFVESATYCGISSFTFSLVQGIVINNGCTPREGNHSTFSHEVAHYFDVFHTHETAYGVECPSGSNCETAGDLVCDTPADPRLSNVVSPACQYTGSAPPPCGEGVPYAPDPRNFMSYARQACRTLFTPGQHDRMLASLLNLRPELGCEWPACPADFDGDGGVDSDDIASYLGSWLQGVNGGGLVADFDQSGAVDSNDISAFLMAWLAAVAGEC